jgi:hypothetical protein
MRCKRPLFYFFKINVLACIVFQFFGSTGLLGSWLVDTYFSFLAAVVRMGVVLVKGVSVHNCFASEKFPQQPDKNKGDKNIFHGTRSFFSSWLICFVCEYTNCARLPDHKKSQQPLSAQAANASVQVQGERLIAVDGKLLFHRIG